jgi:hypothetical protein
LKKNKKDPITQFPTTYFIGNSGAPIESISGTYDKELLEERIQNAIKIHKTPIKVSGSPEQTSSSASTSQESDQDQKKKLDERVAL